MNSVPDREGEDVLAMQEVSLDDPPPQEASTTVPPEASASSATLHCTHSPSPEEDLEKAIGGEARNATPMADKQKDVELSDGQSKKSVDSKVSGEEEDSEEEDSDEDTTGTAERWRLGRALGLTRVRVLFWSTVLVVPTLFIVLIILIPLGNPNYVFDKHGAWPFVFFVNPLIMAIIAYLHLTPYWGCHGDQRPFTLFPEKLPIMIVVYALEVIVILCLVILFDFFSFIGLISLGLAFVVAFFATWVWQRLQKREALLMMFRHYMKIVALLYIHLVILAGYVILFRELPSNLQSLLTFALSIVVFINRKIMLSFTDPFPIELAMLISGFWINNLSDMFQTLAYPNVKNPLTFLYMWLINFVGDVANLVFLTSFWFKIRVWIKAVLQGKCRKMPKPNYEDTNPDERGHSNNRPGYRRRQARFYFWRITSKLVAVGFYFAVSIVLRYYDPNNQYYNFSNDPYTIITSSGGEHPNVLSESDYRNSLIYMACNFVVALLAGFVGYALLRWHWRDVYKQLAPIARTLARNHTFIGFIVSIVAHNGLMAIVFLQYHQRIWWYDLSFM